MFPPCWNSVSKPFYSRRHTKSNEQLTLKNSCDDVKGCAASNKLFRLFTFEVKYWYRNTSWVLLNLILLTYSYFSVWWHPWKNRSVFFYECDHLRHFGRSNCSWLPLYSLIGTFLTLATGEAIELITLFRSNMYRFPSEFAVDTFIKTNANSKGLVVPA